MKVVILCALAMASLVASTPLLFEDQLPPSHDLSEGDLEVDTDAIVCANGRYKGHMCRICCKVEDYKTMMLAETLAATVSDVGEEGVVCVSGRYRGKHCRLCCRT